MFNVYTEKLPALTGGGDPKFQNSGGARRGIKSKAVSVGASIKNNIGV